MVQCINDVSQIPLKENKKLSAQNFNCNTVGLDFQMYRYM